MAAPSRGTRLTAAALEIAGLTYAYSRGAPTLDAVTFAVPAGSFTALLGPNGAGKTTLMSLVTRLFAPGAGTIRVNGLDLAAAPRQALAAMGVVFQRPTVDLDLTVEQNLRYAAALHGLPGAQARERIEGALARLGMDAQRRAAVRTLSGGQRRRVELARALLHRPQLLILDEPTVGLDVDSRQAIVDYCHELCAEQAMAVLWTTHLIDEVRGHDRVVVLAGGKVRAAGGVAQVVAQAGTADLGTAYRHLTRPAAPAAAEAAAAA